MTFNFKLDHIHGVALVMCSSRQAKADLLAQAKQEGVPLRNGGVLTRHEVAAMHRIGATELRPLFIYTEETPKPDRSMLAWSSRQALSFLSVVSWAGVYDGQSIEVHKDRPNDAKNWENFKAALAGSERKKDT